MSSDLRRLLTPLRQARPLLVANSKLVANRHDKAEESSDTGQTGLAL